MSTNSITKQQKRDLDYSAARRAVLTSHEPWDKKTLIGALDNAVKRGWNGKALKAYAWAFWLDGKYQRVTPQAWRHALFFGLNPSLENSPYASAAEGFRQHYEADPSRYSFVR